MYLQWNDQFGASGNDYDLYICRAGLRPTDFNLLNGFCTSSQDTQNGDDDPQETASNGADEVDVFIKRDSGQGRRLKFYAVAFSFSGVQRSVSVAEHGVMEGGITQHEAVPGVLAVGAVPVGDPGNDDIVDYSDQGPSRIYFPTEETRMKPDVVASTCVSVTGSGGFPKIILRHLRSRPSRRGDRRAAGRGPEAGRPHQDQKAGRGRRHPANQGHCHRSGAGWS